MSFTISLRKNTSPVNYVDKNTTESLSVTGSLRDGTSIIDPVIIFESYSSHFLADLNYMYIAEFNRYYFVTNIISLRTNLWQITAHVDVLMSWKAELLANGTGVVKRQENQYNLYLDDGIFKCYQDPLIQCINFPSGFTTQEFVLAVAGANAVNNSPTPDPAAPDVPTPGPSYLVKTNAFDGIVTVYERWNTERTYKVLKWYFEDITIGTINGLSFTEPLLSLRPSGNMSNSHSWNAACYQNAGTTRTGDMCIYSGILKYISTNHGAWITGAHLYSVLYTPHPDYPNSFNLSNLSSFVTVGGPENDTQMTTWETPPA